MKITKIRFQNLNSLNGSWCIDFTDPAYLENSLFAITGPTGAGKSTILDAICLSLYGRTPRLEKLTKTSNELMSRHTGVCFAEVEFTTMQGSFRCHWSQHRSRKKAIGELQQPKHEIADADTGAILESKLRNIIIKVEDVTGMDFDRFTRSVLLAQGGFAAFLKAKPDERSPLLEQITGSKIYSHISMKVHEMYGTEKTKFEQLERNLAHIEILAEEEEAELGLLLQAAEKIGAELKKSIAEQRLKQQWLINIDTLQVEIEKHEKQLIVLENEEKQQKDVLAKLPPALAAKELDPFYLELQKNQTNLQTTLTTSTTIQKTLIELKPALVEILQKKETSQNILHKTETERTTGLELIQKVREQDHVIKNDKKVLKEQKAALSKDSKKEEIEQLHINKLTKELQTTNKSIQTLTLFFSKRAGDEKLVTEYILFEEKIKKLLDLRKHSQAAKTSAQHSEVTKIKDKLTNIKTETTEVHKELEYLQSKLQLLVRIQSLEDERKRLLANVPCPLCGATEHPYRNKHLVEISKEEKLEHLIEIQEMLHSRAMEWKANKEEEKLLLPHLLKLQSDIEHAKKQQQTLQEQIKKKKEIFTLQQTHLSSCESQREKLFGHKNTEKESKKLEQNVTTARKQLETLQQKHLEKEKEITAAESKQLQLQDEQKRQQQDIDILQNLFTKMLHDSPFDSIEEFLNAKLTNKKILLLQNASNKLQKERTELTSLLKNKKEQLTQEQEKQKTPLNIVTLGTKLKELEQELEKQRETSISTQKQLAHNTAEKQKAQKELENIARHKHILSRWARLHMLIGSADGKKFRNFAQGLTFEMMVGHANTHLAKMNNRYILIRDTAQPLDLNVIDTYQAGEIRSTKNLSGGESFLVSLALALGLSRMASNKIRVDSLFLDEGFGTLDEDALESALDTLSSLQEENKLIGVISHVAALKNRIPLQIAISNNPNGKSSMTGPGISNE